ncbi:MAG TPA: hypothetical protein V6D00_12745 [Pantanalinema sp.]
MNVNRTSAVQRPLRAPRVASAPQLAEDAVSTVGRLMGTRARKHLSAGALIKDAAVGGVANVPFDGLFSSQAYRRGELKANEYVARLVSSSVGGVVWTAGGALAGVMLAPLGLPALAVGIAGFALGMTAQGLFDRFMGYPMAKKLAELIPEKGVQPIADAFTKYVANPLNDYVWRPVVDTVKENKVLAAGVAGALALKFPGAARAIGKEALTMGGGMAAGLALELGVITPALGEAHDPFERPEQQEADVDPQWLSRYQALLDKASSMGATPEEARQAAQAYLVRTLESNGAPQEEAMALVAAMDRATQARPASEGKSFPPGMLMAR